MVYEKKAQSALEEFLDAIYYEEGRLALINKLGPALSDEDKATATQLITAQRADLDRLLDLFKKDLEPLMSDICKNGEAMAPLVSKLLSTGTQVQQVVESTNNNEAAMVAAPAEEVSKNDTAVMVNAGVQPSETVVVADAPGEDTTNSVAVEGATDVSAVPAGNNEVVATGSEAAAVTEGAVVTGGAPVEGMSDNAGAVEGTSSEIAPPAEGNGGEVAATEGAAVPAEGTGSEVAAEVPADSTNAAPVEETVPFVLSPMDEDVAPIPTKEETQAAEKGIAAADQQLQAIEGMKNDIINDTSLTDTEKTVSLGKYTRMTADTVRAILVTKAQYEKLLSSRDVQKGLLKPEGGLTEATGDAVAAEETKDEVALTIPGTADTTPATDGVTSEASTTAAAVEASADSPIPAIVGGDSAQAEATASSDNGGVLELPTAGGTTTENTPAEANPATNAASTESALVLPLINNDNVSAEQSAAVEQTGGVLELPTAGGTTTENAPAEAQGGSNELQAMIEQANALYKEGKTAEAQALFEKIGAMNKGTTGEGATAEVADAAKVLVKQ